MSFHLPSDEMTIVRDNVKVDAFATMAGSGFSWPSLIANTNQRCLISDAHPSGKTLNNHMSARWMSIAHMRRHPISQRGRLRSISAPVSSTGSDGASLIKARSSSLSGVSRCIFRAPLAALPNQAAIFVPYDIALQRAFAQHVAQPGLGEGHRASQAWRSQGLRVRTCAQYPFGQDFQAPVLHLSFRKYCLRREGTRATRRTVSSSGTQYHGSAS